MRAHPDACRACRRASCLPNGEIEGRGGREEANRPPGRAVRLCPTIPTPARCSGGEWEEQRESRGDQQLYLRQRARPDTRTSTCTEGTVSIRWHCQISQPATCAMRSCQQSTRYNARANAHANAHERSLDSVECMQSSGQFGARPAHATHRQNKVFVTQIINDYHNKYQQFCLAPTQPPFTLDA